jgi:hypothetical protein
MPFPPIRHCLICESVRLEVGRKTTLLGFYGVAPEVSLRQLDFRIPVQIAFVLICDAGQGTYQISVRIVGQSGTPVMELPPVSVTIPPGPRAQLNLVVGGVVFPRAGRYTLQVLSDQSVIYETSFEMEQGEESEFRISS